ncbi:MAG: iron-containing alcohol dehydrogenase [Clostridia bacterium]|nr:iron-containing alcohol dehydrogenase [Clostridia bacterium]
MKTFEVKTKINFGQNALDRLLDFKTERVLIIADPFVVSSGLIRQVTGRLDRTQVTYEIYQDVVPDPPIEKIIGGVRQLMAFHPDYIVAVGGGSALDLAKGVRKFAAEMSQSERIPMFAIPTTSGTGSEVTSFAVITDSEANRKYPLSSDDMIPDEAILDEELVKSVPASITADTGMDVMTHAIEAYVSINNNEFSGALAEKSVEICGQFLLRSYASCEDSHARRKMHIASCLAGLAFNSASLGLTHGMAHQLGAKFHIPHGRANAILLPTIIQYNSRIDRASRSRKEYDPCVRKYCNVARVLGVSNLNEITTVHALVAYLRFMNSEMDIPSNIRDLGSVSAADYFEAINDMAAAALADGCTATNPRTPTLEEVIELYKKIW